MNITALPALNDNYIWLIEHEGQALCIDPGDAAPVLAHLQAHNLTLTHIWLTHHHDDHTGGVADLRQLTGAEVYGGSDIARTQHTVAEGSRLSFGGMAADVHATTGHTSGHLSYFLHHNGRVHVFCGDTLFSGGCGRVFTGTVQQLAASLHLFNSLPEDTLFYPAHEYTASNLRFAAHIEPDNTDIQAALQQSAHTPTLPVSLAHERRINPFLRTTLPHIAARAEALCGRELADADAVFAALRELKNGF